MSAAYGELKKPTAERPRTLRMIFALNSHAYFYGDVSFFRCQSSRRISHRRSRVDLLAALPAVTARGALATGARIPRLLAPPARAVPPSGVAGDASRAVTVRVDSRAVDAAVREDDRAPRALAAAPR